MCSVLNMSRNRFEIGSEFWFEDDLPQAVSDRDGVYALSGRTAIDLIIQDILKTRKIRNVYMPAWCCDSMLAPFVARGIDIKFYDISLAESADTAEILCDFCDFRENIFYVTNYFGYENTLPVETVKNFKEQGSIILYDRTHSFLMGDDPYLALADYSFASIRKWMGVIGGAVVSGVKDCQLKPGTYLACKEEAMRMKKAFIGGDETIDKQSFLDLYAEFGHHLAEDYQNYEMDDLSYAIYMTEDLSAIRRNRRENAKYLHDHLNLNFLCHFTDNAVPLFVPVFFKSTEQRNAVRKKLKEAQIYCPIHWPKPAQIPADCEANKIYDTELSLICDQRYNLEDMQRIVAIMNEHDFR